MVYSFVEIRPLDSDKDSFVVCHSVVDLRDYNLDELWEYCSGYYTSYEQMVESYGFRGALQIMAECVFEQLSYSGMEFNAAQDSKSSAVAFLLDWIQSVPKKQRE